MSHPTTFTTRYPVRRRGTGEWDPTPTITAGEARACLAAAILDRPDKPCPVNKNMSRADCHRILLAAVSDIADEKPIDHRIAANVLRLVLHRKRL